MTWSGVNIIITFEGMVGPLCLEEIINNIIFTPAGYNYAPLINNQLYFSSLDQQFCLNITLMDNSVVEERMVQTFTIELSTDNNLVNISHPAVVEIIDDDCEYYRAT